LSKRLTERMIAKGWVVKLHRPFRNRFGAASIQVLALTFLGNYLYCTSLPDDGTGDRCGETPT
jgi:hypothetical protein